MVSETLSGWLATGRMYVQRRLIVIFLLGFASGLPFLLIGGTLSAWLSEVGVSKTSIGLFALAGTVFAISFTWAPLVDRLPLPLLTRLMGQRRSWLIVAQLACIASLIALGFSNPAENLLYTAAMTLCLAVASATQDIVLNAYRIETLSDEEQGAGAANYQLGYRLAIILAGAGALIMADFFGWLLTYLVMASFMLVGVLTTLFSPEPDHPVEEDISGLTRTERYKAWIKRAVIAPFADFMTRPGWVLVLLFVVFYKYADGVWAFMANPFYLETGFTLTQIGVVSKTYGVVMTMIGVVIGGLMIARYGLLKSVMFGAITMAVTNLGYAALAMVGASIPAFVVVISLENLANGIGGTAFIAYLSSLCNIAYTATQYTLLMSFANFSRTVLASGGGWVADQVDWVTFFILTTLAGIPGILLLLYMMRRYPHHTEAGHRQDDG